jgi:hypothetical protein
MSPELIDEDDPANTSLKVHLHEIFYSGFLHRSIPYWSYWVFSINLIFAEKFSSFSSDSVDVKSHSPSTESTSSEIPHPLSREVKLHVNWVDVKCWNIRKSRRIPSTHAVDVESHSALAQATFSHSVLTEFTGSFTPYRLSVQKMNKAITGILTPWVWNSLFRIRRERYAVNKALGSCLRYGWQYISGLTWPSRLS